MLTSFFPQPNKISDSPLRGGKMLAELMKFAQIENISQEDRRSRLFNYDPFPKNESSNNNNRYT